MIGQGAQLNFQMIQRLRCRGAAWKYFFVACAVLRTRQLTKTALLHAFAPQSIKELAVGLQEVAQNIAF